MSKGLIAEVRYWMLALLYWPGYTGPISFHRLISTPCSKPTCDVTLSKTSQKRISAGSPYKIIQELCVNAMLHRFLQAEISFPIEDDVRKTTYQIP